MCRPCSCRSGDTGSNCDRTRRWRASRRMPCCSRSCSRRGFRSDMFLTALPALLTALGVVPIALLGALGWSAWAVFGGWLLLCAALVTLDVVLAASPRAVVVTRRIPSRARLGEPVATSIAVQNIGSRTRRGWLRDAWQPTAGAPLARERIDIPPGERRRVQVPLLPRRRGELSSDFVVIRSRGPLGLAGRQGRHDV